MNISFNNPKQYRKNDLQVGDMANTENYFHSGLIEDESGKVIRVNGTCEVWGNVVSTHNKFCRVKCNILHFKEQNIWIPIKKQYMYETSINYRYGNEIEDKGETLEQFNEWLSKL